MNPKEKYSQKLLVEGIDDYHVMLAICAREGITESFDVVENGGFPDILERAKLRFKTSDLTTIGIVVDADVDQLVRWNELKEFLKLMGYDAPEDLPKQGLILSPHAKIRVGVWLMPDNRCNGMLEDFLKFAVPSADGLLPVVEQHISEIERMNLNKYKLAHHQKAILHSWLALHDPPGIPLGLAITKRFFSNDHPYYNIFVGWLNALFNQAS